MLPQCFTGIGKRSPFSAPKPLLAWAFAGLGSFSPGAVRSRSTGLVSSVLLPGSQRSVRWVASQLGHTRPELILRVYVHALGEAENDFSFLGFGGTRRHPRGTKRIGASATKKPHRVTSRRGFGIMERETGFEPATLSLGS